MTKAVVIIIIFCATITWLLAEILSLRIEDNCWSRFDTEEQAIENCEVHNG